MTADERARLMGDALTETVDDFVQLVWPGNERAPVVVSDFLAVLLERVTSLAASPMMHFNERQDRLEERMAALEAQFARHIGQVDHDAQAEAEADGG